MYPEHPSSALKGGITAAVGAALIARSESDLASHYASAEGREVPEAEAPEREAGAAGTDTKRPLRTALIPALGKPRAVTPTRRFRVLARTHVRDFAGNPGRLRRHRGGRDRDRSVVLGSAAPKIQEFGN